MGLSPGPVHAPVVEPGLTDALETAFADSLRRLGIQPGRSVSIDVTQASFTPSLARDGAVHAYSAELALRFTAQGADSLALRRSLALAAPGGGSSEISALRASAFRELAQLLMEEAIALYCFGPTSAADAGSPEAK